MTTKAVKTRKNGKANATVRKEVKEKLTQRAVELKIQNLNIEGHSRPDATQKDFQPDFIKRAFRKYQETRNATADYGTRVRKRFYNRYGRTSLSCQ